MVKSSDDKLDHDMEIPLLATVAVNRTPRRSSLQAHESLSCDDATPPGLSTAGKPNTGGMTFTIGQGEYWRDNNGKAAIQRYGLGPTLGKILLQKSLVNGWV